MKFSIFIPTSIIYIYIWPITEPFTVNRVIFRAISQRLAKSNITTLPRIAPLLCHFPGFLLIEHVVVESRASAVTQPAEARAHETDEDAVRRLDVVPLVVPSSSFKRLSASRLVAKARRVPRSLFHPAIRSCARVLS